MLRIERPRAAGGSVQIRCTDRFDGDFAIAAAPGSLAARRRGVSPHPVTWLEQVHGVDVVTVVAPGEGQGTVADGAVTAVPASTLSVQTADCAPVVLIATGAVGVAHAGWRGLADGVLDSTLAALRRLDNGPVEALLGPCIGPAHYEFGTELLDGLADRFGPQVRSQTVDGDPAFDLPAAVAAALAPVVDEFTVLGHDTADERWFSHRVRGDRARQATMVWIEP